MAGAIGLLQRVILIDAKPGRAALLGHRLEAAGLPTTSLTGQCEDILPSWDGPERRVVLSVDNLTSMAESARRLHQAPAIAQGVGQGVRVRGGEAPATFGLHLALDPQRPRERDQAIELLDAFALLSPPVGSATLRQDPISAAELHRIRLATSRLTAHRLLEGSRPDDEVLSRLVWQDGACPLVVIRARETTSTRLTELALEHGRPRGLTAVVLSNPQAPRIDVFVVEPSQRRRGSLLRLWVPFQRLFAAPAGNPSAQNATFTD